MTRHAPSRDERDRSLASGGDLTVSALVEAGAGTGKTSVLIDRLLALVRAGTSLSRIVAITFTEKAAGELRVRLRTELEKGARPPEAGRGAHRAGEAVGAENPAADVSDAERALLEAALHEIDRAQIGTIHGFCTSLLKERPVEAGVDPGFGVAEELRQTLIQDAAWDAWLREELGRGLPEPVAEASAIGFGLAKIRELGDKLLSQRDLLDLAPGPADPGDVTGFMARLVAAARAFEDTAASECGNPDDRALAEIAGFAAEVRAMNLLPPGARPAYALHQVQPAPGSLGRKENWRGDALAGLKAEAKALKDIQADLRRRASHNAAVGLLSWLRGYTLAYEDEKRRLGLLDFEDLLLKARLLLWDNHDVREYFKNAYDRILVDEFQDTDPLQCEVVFFLAEKGGKLAADWMEVELEPGKLFLVGDPKQSIYRFRRADIEMYELAKEIVARQGTVWNLTENFRCRTPVVEGVNLVFREKMTPPTDGRRYQPAYVELLAHRAEDDRGPGIVILSSASEEANGRGRTDGEGEERPRPAGAAPTAEKPSADEVRAEEARAVAAFIAEAIASRGTDVYDKDEKTWRPLAQKDIAVLFHATTGLDAYCDAMNERELEYRIAGGRKFFVRREVRELTTVLAAIEDPNNAVAVVGALRTPFFGVSDEDIVLHRLAAGTLNYLAHPDSESSAIRDSFGILGRLHRSRNSGGIAALIRDLFERTRAPELFLMKPTGEQRHANLLKVMESAAALEKTELVSFGGFVRWLREASQLTPEEADSPLSEEGDDFIRMLTIHKAKGLEFPVVVLADLARRRARPENLIVDREEGRLDLGIGPEGARLATLGYEEALEREKDRRDAEIVRLLYVGMTRARDMLVVPWFPSARANENLLTRLEALRAPGRGRGVALHVTEKRDLGPRAPRPFRLSTKEALATDPSSTAAFAECRAWEERRTGFVAGHNRPPRIIAPSSLARGSEGEPERDLDETSPVPHAGARLGTLVHVVMERISFDAPADAAPLARALARTAGYDDLAEEAAVLVERALRSPVIERARRARLAIREMPFAIAAADDTLIEGKIDLLFEEDGGLVVVDYKTDAVRALGAGAIVERYRRQAEAYGLAVAGITGLPVKEVVLLLMQSGEGAVVTSVADPDVARGTLRTLLETAQPGPDPERFT